MPSFTLCSLSQNDIIDYSFQGQFAEYMLPTSYSSHFVVTAVWGKLLSFIKRLWYWLLLILRYKRQIINSVNLSENKLKIKYWDQKVHCISSQPLFIVTNLFWYILCSFISKRLQLLWTIFWKTIVLGKMGGISKFMIICHLRSHSLAGEANI